MNFLKNLDILLFSRKMTRSDLARAIDISPSTINSWYNRSCEGVTLKNLIKISNYFNISLDDLVNGETFTPATNNDNLSKDEIAQLKRILAYYDKLGGGLNV